MCGAGEEAAQIARLEEAESDSKSRSVSSRDLNLSLYADLKK